MNDGETKSTRIASIIALVFVLLWTAKTAWLAMRVPYFEGIYADMGVALPRITQIALSLSPYVVVAVLCLITIAGIVKEFLVTNKTATLVVNGVHLVVLFVVYEIYTEALFWPLFGMLKAMQK